MTMLYAMYMIVTVDTVCITPQYTYIHIIMYINMPHHLILCTYIYTTLIYYTTPQASYPRSWTSSWLPVSALKGTWP